MSKYRDLFSSYFPAFGLNTERDGVCPPYSVQMREKLYSIETYAYVIIKDLVNEKEDIKCNNIIKWIRKWLTLMMLQKKT